MSLSHPPSPPPPPKHPNDILESISSLCRSLIELVTSAFDRTSTQFVHLSHCLIRFERQLYNFYEDPQDSQVWAQLRTCVDEIKNGLQNELRHGSSKWTSILYASMDLSHDLHSFIDYIKLYPIRFDDKNPDAPGLRVQIEDPRHSHHRRKRKLSDRDDTESELERDPRDLSKFDKDPLPLRMRLAFTYYTIATDPKFLDTHKFAGPITIEEEKRTQQQDREKVAARPRKTEPDTIRLDDVYDRVMSKEELQTIEATFANGTEPDKAEAWERFKSALWEPAQKLMPVTMRRDEVKERDVKTAFATTTTSFDLGSICQSLCPLFDLLARLCSVARDEQVAEMVTLATTIDRPEQLVGVFESAMMLILQMTEDAVFIGSLAYEVIGPKAYEQMVYQDKAIEMERRVIADLIAEQVSSSGRSLSAREHVISATKLWIEQQLATDASPALNKVTFTKALVTQMFPLKDEHLHSQHEAAPWSGNEPPINPHGLPFSLLIVSPKICQLRNKVQACLIVACVNTLVRLAPPSSRNTPADAQGQEFVSRIWAHLRPLLVDRNFTQSARVSDSDPLSPEAKEARLVNLSDEVVRYHSLHQQVVKPEDIKKTVERILRDADPVNKLLSKRLTEGILAEIEEGNDKTSSPANVELKTGRALSQAQFDLHAHKAQKKKSMIKVKGFEWIEDRVSEVTGEIHELVGWVDLVWGRDLFPAQQH